MIEKNSNENITFLNFDSRHDVEHIDDLIMTDNLINNIIFNVLKSQGLDDNESLAILVDVYASGGYPEVYQVCFELLQDMQLPDITRKHFKSCGMEDKSIDIALKIIDIEKKKYAGSSYCWFNIWSYYLSGDDQNNNFRCPNLVRDKKWRSGKDALIDLYNQRYKFKSSMDTEDQYYNVYLSTKKLKKETKKIKEKS